MSLEDRIARLERLIITLNPTAMRCPPPWTAAQWQLARMEMDALARDVMARSGLSLD